MKQGSVFLLSLLITASLALLFWGLRENETPGPVKPETVSKQIAQEPTEELASESVGQPAETMRPRPHSPTPSTRGAVDFSQWPILSEGHGPLASSPREGRVLQFASPRGSWPLRVEYEQIERLPQASACLMVANRILVVGSSETSVDEIAALAAQLNGRLLPRQASEDRAYLMEFDGYTDSALLPLLLKELNAMVDLVEFAEPDYVYRAARIPNDPEFRRQRELDTISSASGIDPDLNALSGWAKRVSAANQIIAVIDSGIQLDNPDLKPNLWRNPKEPIDGKDNDANGYVDDVHGADIVDPTTAPDDTDGHGTAVAGLIGAKGNNGVAIAGVTWETQLMAVRIISDDGFATASDAALAIDYAVLNGAKIINASWGGKGESIALKRAIERANLAGVLFVAAAGNEYQDLDIDPLFPAAYILPNVLSVAASDRWGGKASFTNWGAKTVHIAAPGDELLSLSIHKDSAVGLFSGTSFSAPLVSGIAALAREEFGPESPAELRRRILSSARLSHERRLEWVASQGYADLDRVLNQITSAPENDDRSGALELDLLNYRYAGHTLQAGTEVGEPLPDATDGWRTVWYKVEAAVSKPFRILISGPWSDGRIHFFSGDDLAPIEPREVESPLNGSFGRYEFSNDDAAPLFIQISSKDFLWFEIQLEAPPPNDDFADAIVLQQEPFVDQTANRFASLQGPEPFPHEAHNSVWWQFIATEDGQLRLSTQGSGVDTVLHAFTGQELASLTSAASNDNASPSHTYSALVLSVVTGETYHFRVASKYHDGGVVKLSGAYLRKPIFITHPSSVSLPAGAQATLRGAAIGPLPLAYQWFHNGQPVAGATSDALVVTNVNEETSGSYTLQASSPGGQVTSAPARLSLLGAGPQFALHPFSGDYSIGQSVTLSAQLRIADGASYQWYKDGEAVPGATSPALQLENLDATDNGTYSIEATNAHGSKMSRTATIFFGGDLDIRWRPVFDSNDFELVGIVERDGQTFWYASEHYNLWQSVDGFTWEQVELLVDGKKVDGSYGAIARIEFGNGRYFVAFTATWAIGTSFDSLFEVGSYDFRNNLSPSHVKFINGYFYLGGEEGMARSIDGMTWESGSAPISQPSSIVSSLSGSAFATIQSDMFHYSTNLVDWTATRLPGSTGNRAPLIHDGKRFVVFLRQNEIYATVDGVEWEKLSSPPIEDDSVRSAVFTGQDYILLAEDGLLVSTDLKVWEELPLDALNIERLCHGNGVLMADGLSMSPVRLNGSVRSQPTPPIITPVGMKPTYKPGPGDTLVFTVEAEGVDAPLDRVEFHHNGALKVTRKEPPFTFTWTTNQAGFHTIDAIAFDTTGKASRVGSSITVATDQTPSLTARHMPRSIVEMAEAFGSTYAISGDGKLFRFGPGASWDLCHSFAEGSANRMFAFRDQLYIKAGDNLYRSPDGMGWEFMARLAPDAYYHPGDAWLVGTRHSYPLIAAQYTFDGETWLEATAEADSVLGVFNGTAVLTTRGAPDKLGLLAPGGELEYVDLPPDLSIYPIEKAFSDGSWFYLLYRHTDAEILDRRVELHRTRDFADWEGFVFPGSLDVWHSNGLYLSAKSFSRDLETWIHTEFYMDDALALPEGYLATTDGEIRHSEDGQTWRTLLSGNARALKKTINGYFAWSNDNGRRGIYFSPDGLRWSRLYERNDHDYTYIEDLAFGNGTYVAVGTRHAISTDAVHWEDLPAWLGLGKEVVFGNGQFLATAMSAGGFEVAISADGKTWQRHQVNETNGWSVGFAFLPKSKLFYLYDDLNRTLLKSSDGIRWSSATSRPIREAFLLENHLYVRFDDDFKIYFSDDGVKWTETEHAAQDYLNGHFYTGNLISDDGYTWEKLSFLKMQDSGGRKIALSDGTVLIETDAQVDGLSLCFRTRGRSLEDWTLENLQAYTGVPHFANGLNFVLSEDISLFTKNDLRLTSVALENPPTSVRVGDSLALNLTIQNASPSAARLTGVALHTRLTQDRAWTDLDGRELQEVVLPDLTIPADSTATVRVPVRIPEGTRPGSFSLVTLLNPDRLFPESTLANNYAWEETAKVHIPEGSLSLAVVGNGRVARAPEHQTYALGDTVLLTAVPDPKHRLKQATGSTLRRQNLYAVTVETDSKATFEFEEARYRIQVDTFGAGTVSMSPVQETYLEGDYVTLTAEPEEDAAFMKWTGSIDESQSTVTLAIRTDLSVTAIFGSTYAQWTKDVFSANQQAEPLTIAEQADPDGDGVTNLWEHLLGSDPNSANAVSAISYLFDGDTLTVNYTFSQTAAEYAVGLESSSDGAGWVTLPIATTPATDSPAHLHGRAILPLDRLQAVFLRLQASRNAPE